MLSLAASLLVALAMQVPYLPQSEDLCGGAAAAMVFRYWGDAHADPEQFASLVDRHAGGIADTALVAAIAARGWHVDRFSGSVGRLREEIERGHPVILLIQDRPYRYHFVVVTGAHDSTVILHDPARGPAQRMGVAALLKAWAPTGFWSLVVTPNTSATTCAGCTAADLPAADERRESHRTPELHTACERLLDAALDTIQRDGLASADAALTPVIEQCPRSPGPIRELAGVRFAERKWSEAAALAERAVAAGDTDPYAAEVLGSSRFMLGNLSDALAAWNRIGKPKINLVRIAGVSRTRYQVVNEILDLPLNALLTPERFERAARRLHELPDFSSAALTYRIEPDGYATVDAAIVEQAAPATAPHAWTATGVHAVVDREIDVPVPGRTGQGELWTASWRYWDGRPRVALSFAAPRVGPIPGVWRVDAEWSSQAYSLDDTGRTAFRETRASGTLSLSDWIAPNLRYQTAIGIESWNGTRRTAHLAARLDRRLLADRVSLSGGVRVAAGIGDAGFSAVDASAAYRSSSQPAGWVERADIGVDKVDERAPFALWPAAGDGHAGERLLRAHPLLRDGVVAGPVFGRTLEYANFESTRWIDTRVPLNVGAAVFVDLAHVASTTPDRTLPPAQIDVGAGLRVRFPGTTQTMRVDIGYGLRDRTHALTFGWVP
jgi:hypothetical protein